MAFSLISAKEKVLKRNFSKHELEKKEDGVDLREYKNVSIAKVGSILVKQTEDLNEKLICCGNINYAKYYKVFQSCLKHGDTAVDIGAGVGIYTMLMSNIVGKKGKVFSFEPGDERYRALKYSIKINGGSNIFARNVALGREQSFALIGKLPEDRHRFKRLFSRFFEWDPEIKDLCDDYQDAELVLVKGLDQFNLNKVKFIRIAARASEFDVLLGARETLLKQRPNILIHIDREAYDASFIYGGRVESTETILSYLRGLGYDSMRIDTDLYFCEPIYAAVKKK